MIEIYRQIWRAQIANKIAAALIGHLGKWPIALQDELLESCYLDQFLVHVYVYYVVFF